MVIRLIYYGFCLAKVEILQIFEISVLLLVALLAKSLASCHSSQKVHRLDLEQCANTKQQID